jgi:hypothetical protein
MPQIIGIILTWINLTLAFVNIAFYVYLLVLVKGKFVSESLRRFWYGSIFLVLSWFVAYVFAVFGVNPYSWLSDKILVSIFMSPLTTLNLAIILFATILQIKEAR